MDTELYRILKEMRHSARAIRRSRVSRRKGKVVRREKLTKGWTYHSTEMNRNFMNSDVFIGASDVYDYVTCNIQAERNELKLPSQHEKIVVLATRPDWMQIVDQSVLRVHKFTDRRGLIIDDNTSSYMSYEIHASTVELNLHGDYTFVSQWVDKIKHRFEVVDNVIEWIYNSDGASIEVPLRSDRLPYEEMYPWLEGETLAEYYDRYTRSDASILLLIGPPGTGKTTFIRGLLQHTKQSAVVTYDPAILAKDFVFAQFIEGDTNVFVIEDADTFLGARRDGNDVMHKFLNVGDGLVTTKNKKLIFSTNLPSIQDVDPALLRPGRCFDIVYFNMLDDKQADALAKRLNVEYDKKDSGQYTLAELFHKQSQTMKKPTRKMGFV